MKKKLEELIDEILKRLEALENKVRKLELERKKKKRLKQLGFKGKNE